MANFTILNIPINMIDENDKNKYSIENIDELAESIKEVGLKQNLDVMKCANGRYKILTGHRRFKALCQLAETDSKYRNIPCTITDLSSVNMPLNDESKEKYLIHITNSTQRTLTDSDLYNQYIDLSAIYKEAVDNGYKLTDKIRNLIASDMKISAAQVGKMDYIRNNASEELLDALQENDISIYEANKVAHLSEEEQITSLAEGKKKIIDTLHKESYTLQDFDLYETRNVFSKLLECYKNPDNYQISKKNFAKLIRSRGKIDVELAKIMKIIDDSFCSSNSS